MELFEDVEPGISSAEEESEEGEVRVLVLGVRVLSGEGDMGDVEIEVAGVGESELVEGDCGSGVGSEGGESDLGDGSGEEEREEGESEGELVEIRHFLGSERERENVWRIFEELKRERESFHRQGKGWCGEA